MLRHWFAPRSPKSLRRSVIRFTRRGCSGGAHAHRDIQSHEKVIRKLKQVELPIMFKELNRGGLLWTKKHFELTDLGSSNGAFLLDELAEVGEQAGVSFRVHACDPNENRIAAYQARAAAWRSLMLGRCQALPMQEFSVQKSDIILATHSLYYSALHWHIASANHPVPYPHFFDKILYSLVNPGGVFQVVMQAEEANESQRPQCNAAFERQYLYPILNAGRKPSPIPMPITITQFRKSFFYYLRDRQLHDRFQWREQFATARVPLFQDSSQLSHEAVATKQTDQPISNAARYAYSRGRYAFFSRKQQSEFLAGLKACSVDGHMQHHSVVCTITRSS